MRCDDVALLLSEAVDGDTPVALPVQRHVESCLRCQAELARYRRMLRGLQLLRTQYLEPAPGVLSQTLVAIGEASERHAIRSLLTGKRPRVRGRRRRRARRRGRDHGGGARRPRPGPGAPRHHARHLTPHRTTGAVLRVTAILDRLAQCVTGTDRGQARGH